MQIINALLPIIVLVFLGALLRSIDFLSEEFFFGLNRLTFYLGLPCLLFYQISRAKFNPGEAGRIFLVLALSTIIILLFSYLLAKLIDLPKHSVGAFVQGCFRSNTAFVGLPVIIYATHGTGHEALVQLASLAMAPLIPLWNILSIFVLAKGGGSSSHNLRGFILSAVSNPIVISCVVAIPFSIFSIRFPQFIDRSLEAVGNMALPVSLLSIGSSLTFSRLKGNIFAAIIASFVNVFVLPATGWALAYFIGMDRTQTMISLILLACPAAAASYIMAQQLGADYHLAGSTVVISTILAVIPLAIIIAVFG